MWYRRREKEKSTLKGIYGKKGKKNKRRNFFVVFTEREITRFLL